MIGKYAKYLLKSIEKDGHYEKGVHLGEWLEPEEFRDKVYGAKAKHPEECTAYLYYSMKTIAEIAKALNKPYAEYEKCAEGAKKAYPRFAELDTDRQARLVRPLALGLLEGDVKVKAQKRLVKAAENYNYRVGTGFLSTPFLLPVLTEAGDADTAYKMLLNPEKPGWLHEVLDGATTVWENWTDKGLIIPPTPEDLTSPLHPTYCMDRPHILYNAKTKKYVAWLKIMSGEVSQFMSVLTADRFEGPYAFARKICKPLDMDTGDFCLHADDATGKAYLWFERPHFQLICATLTDDYTAVTDEYSVRYDGLLPPDTREAPTCFERNGKRYLVTSGTSGYYPNPSRVCVFDDPHGKYEDLGLICEGDKTGTSFSAQFTSVVRIPGTDRYIACADRWMPQWYVKPLAKQIISGMKRHFADYRPDTSPRKAEPLPGKEIRHGENTSVSRYVWLPIDWQGDRPVIRWRKEWRLEG